MPERAHHKDCEYTPDHDGICGPNIYLEHGGMVHYHGCDKNHSNAEFCNKNELEVRLQGASADAPIEVNERGGKQSAIGYRFDLIDGPALAAMAAVLHEGAVKYGENNWRLIDVHDHINHLLMHAYAYLAGDTQDDHLSHILCRATFAQAVALQGGPLDELPVQ